jgi:hypothetical protein
MERAPVTQHASRIFRNGYKATGARNRHLEKGSGNGPWRVGLARTGARVIMTLIPGDGHLTNGYGQTILFMRWLQS